MYKTYHMINDSFPGWDSISDAEISQSRLDWDFKRVLSKARAQDKRNRRKPFYYAFAYAMAAALLVTAGAVISSHFNTPETIVSESIEYIAARGEIKEVVLPDDSKVVLNSGSVLICPKEFGKTRSVYLMGEAIFDVTASDANPFIVSTSDMRIRVHGTRFNVKAYFDDNDVRATLCRGAIEAWPADNADRKIDLTPGQTLTYDKESGSMDVSFGFTSEATSWEAGELCFRSESISGIVRILERHFNINIYLTTDKYDDAKITANFIHGESLEDLLKAISAVVPGMKYSIDGDKIYLK